MRRAPAVLAIVLSLSALPTLAGCARTAVDIRYPETAANRAVLASLAPRRVGVRPVTDARVDPGRIGTRAENRAIVTKRPVPDIVREALVIELTTNGHAVVPDAADVVLTAEVEDFWLDAVGSSTTTQYVGRVVVALAVTDGRTGDRLLARRYTGIRRQQAEADSKKAWREVMDTALSRTMRDIATDPELVAAIARAGSR